MQNDFSYDHNSIYRRLENGNKQRIVEKYKQSYENIPLKVKMCMGLSNQIKKGDVSNRIKSRVDDITEICADLYQSFLDLKNDFAKGRISEEKYKAYLNIYVKLIDCSDLKLNGEALHEHEVLDECKKQGLL